MARPAAEIILSKDFLDGKRWEILKAEYTYIIIYKDEPVNIRVSEGLYNKVKYKKLSYTNLGNALRQVKFLNHKFNCEDFSLIKVKGTI